MNFCPSLERSKILDVFFFQVIRPLLKARSSYSHWYFVQTCLVSMASCLDNCQDHSTLWQWPLLLSVIPTLHLFLLLTLCKVDSAVPSSESSYSPLESTSLKEASFYTSDTTLYISNQAAGLDHTLLTNEPTFTLSHQWDRLLDALCRFNVLHSSPLCTSHLIRNQPYWILYSERMS